jgi:parallel beta-helix repeat protein
LFSQGSFTKTLKGITFEGLLEEKVVKKFLLVIFALALLASTIYVEGNLPKAKAAALPQETLQSYRLYSDGEGSTPSIHWDGTKFTLTENIEATITLMNDSIMLDGAGFTVKGKGDSIGIATYDKNNVTIKNVIVENFQIGILFGHYSPDAFLWYDPNPNRPTNCTIINCQVSNNTIGISSSGGIKCKIIGNQITDNENGIYFFGSENVFRNNRMKNNRFNFEDLTYGTSEVDSSNTINGKPIYYLVNQHNITVPVDASMVQLENCSNITIRNLDINSTYWAISLFNSSNCKIYGNTLTDNEIGISLRNSANNLIIGNELLNNSNDAIEQYDSENTTIANNLIRANGGGIDSTGYSAGGSGNAVISSNQIIANSGCGIQAGTSCTIIGNYIEGNEQHGIYFWDISNSIVSKNTIKQNGNSGVAFRTGSNASITGNDISKNSVGLEMGDSTIALSKCAITGNNFVQNTNLTIRIDGNVKDNRFYLNNFIDNSNGSLQVSIKGRLIWQGEESYNESSVFPQYAISYNAWDNGSVGNFWSDNNSTAEGATYKIADRNVDNHPLLSPMKFSVLELPSTDVPQELSALTQSKKTESASFPTVLVLAIVLPAIGIVAAIFIYERLKKR